MNKRDYRYSFDTSTIGDVWFPREIYETIQEGLKHLRDLLNVWNKRVATKVPPYEKEVNDLDQRITWAEERFAELQDPHGEIYIYGISVGSLRLIKAGLELLIFKKREDLKENRKQGWPSGALKALEHEIHLVREKSKLIKEKPADVLWEVIPQPSESDPDDDNSTWDVFICHASEDREELARPLANALDDKGLRVWFDEFTLTIGDNLQRSIDYGLSRSNYGVVIISHNFFAKEWPQKELDGLMTREVEGKKVILPVWHNIEAEEIREYSPMLAGRVAVSSRKGLQTVVGEILKVMDR